MARVSGEITWSIDLGAAGEVDLTFGYDYFLGDPSVAAGPEINFTFITYNNGGKVIDVTWLLKLLDEDNLSFLEESVIDLEMENNEYDRSEEE